MAEGRLQCRIVYMLSFEGSVLECSFCNKQEPPRGTALNPQSRQNHQDDISIRSSSRILLHIQVQTWTAPGSEFN